MHLETEVKFVLEDLDSPRRRLVGEGALDRGLVFEENMVLDTPDGALRGRDVLLRLRRAGGRAVLTVKTRVEGPVPAGLKTRREIETGLGDFDEALEAFFALGYVPVLRYEKFRRTLSLPDLDICLDRLPFGSFVEFEGQPEAIARIVARLGLDPAKGLTATYHELHQAFRRGRGLSPQPSFVFAPEEREVLAASLGIDRIAP